MNRFFMQFSVLVVVFVGLAMIPGGPQALAQVSDPCTTPTVGHTALPVGSATGCGAVITVTAVDSSGNATAFFVTITGNGNPFEGSDDTLVGIQNSSGGPLSSITLSSTDVSNGGLFSFDGDGVCQVAEDPTRTKPSINTNDCFHGYPVPEGYFGYEGPDNTFTQQCDDTCPSGTVNFTAAIPINGSTWFSLEETPQAIAQITQTGQPMNPGSTANLKQDFIFNNATGGLVEFGFDYNTAYNTPNPDPDPSDLTVQTDTVPTIAVGKITPATYTEMVANTSLATTSCLLDPGLGTDANNNPLYCPVFTLTCTNTGANNGQPPAGDACPQSAERNLLFNEQIDASSNVTLPSNTAVTLAMGSDTWSPGNCNLIGGETGDLCPQSELTAFQLAKDGCLGCKGGGTGTLSNSTFVFGQGEPEWSTVPVNLPAWTNNTTVNFSLTSTPPNIGCGAAADCNGWVASPNKSITWGYEAVGATPDTTFPVTVPRRDTTVLNTAMNPPIAPCTNSATWPIFGTVPPTATTPSQQISGLTPGVTYEIHFFSTACDNQEELAFPLTSAGAPLNQNLATFKTASFEVDTQAPTITNLALIGGTGINNNAFAPGATVTASFTCNDNLSGLAKCGNALPAVQQPGVQTGQPVTTARVGPTAGPLNQAVNNFTVTAPKTAGQQTLTVYATDLAGNQSSASVNYYVGYCVTSMDNAGNIGFTAPVLNPGGGALPNVNSASASQAIPMKITVTDCNGNPVTNLTLGSPYGAGTVLLTAGTSSVCAADNPDNTLSTGAAGNSGWQNLGSGIYQYNWQPRPPKGTCASFTLNLGDGIPYTAYFKFK